MPYQLFHKLTQEEVDIVKKSMMHLDGLINEAQRDQWLGFFCGGIPTDRLEWNGSLQEAYYLFNQLRINSLSGNIVIRVITKNRGLDWVKFNKVLKTRFGKIQKESRPLDTQEFRATKYFIYTISMKL